MLVRNVILTLLLVVSVSEACLVEWGLRVSRGEGLSAGNALFLLLALAAGNAAFIVFVRRLPWRIRPIYWTTRAYTVASLGALISGPPLLGFLALGVPLAWIGAEELSRFTSLAGGGVAVAIGFGSIAWGLVVGQRRLVVEEVDLPIPDLPESLAGLRIAHLSDLHIGRQLRAPRLRQFVERVNRLGCEAIVLTGDIFDFDPVFIDEGCRELAALRAPLGVYAVLGNHDVYTGADAVAEGLQRLTRIRLLRNEWVWVNRGEGRLALLGIDDPGRNWTDRDSRSRDLENLAKGVPGGVPRILLAHRPSFFDQAARLGINVVLSGHTHGGQISLPAPFHHHNISRLISRWTRGLFEQDGTLLYVSRGLGVAGPPVRLNCPREIATLKLIPRT
jgi:predicted MPP superfamily phosphohydrolase